jgi:NADH-quinone oxidoreductase subunit D
MSEPVTEKRPTLFDVKEMELNFGPQHPSTHGVLRLKLKVDGERVVDCYPIIGYLHRGTEKLFELHPFVQNVPHTDRMDYIAAATSNLAYVGAVEKMMGFTTPPRARYIRVLLCELQRISSHLLWLATHAIDIGAMTPFFYCFRERELILDLFEDYCGARLTLNCMRPGGQPYDLPIGWTDRCAEFVGTFNEKVDEYEGLLTNNRIWKQRTVGIGVLPPELALEYGISGPMLRGSGVQWDLRKARPYEAYDEVEFDVPVGQNCDTYDRYLVRIEEMRQSARIIARSASTSSVTARPIRGAATFARPLSSLCRRCPICAATRCSPIWWRLSAPPTSCSARWIADGRSRRVHPRGVGRHALLLRLLAVGEDPGVDVPDGAAVGDGDDPDRAQAARLHAVSHRPQPCRSLGSAAADRRRRQAARQRGRDPA